MANWREVYSLRMFREKAQVKLFCTATFRVAASCLQGCYLVPNQSARGNQVLALHEIINLQMDKTDDTNYKSYGYSKPLKVSEKRTKYESAG